MKKLLTLAALSLTVAALLLTSVSAAVSAAIVNGGFEGDAAANVSQNGSAAVALTVSTEKAHSGKSSLKISNRDNEHGALAVNVKDYIKATGTGSYYCTFWINGTFDGSIRATLHTTHEDGGDFYRQIGDLTPFKNGEWTLIGLDASGNPLPLRIENWPEEDHSKWDPMVASEGLTNATLYFWVEGNNNGDFYIDELNFWGCNDSPVEFNPKTADNFMIGAAVLTVAAAAAVVITGKKH